jgi:hypothetical protein
MDKAMFYENYFILNNLFYFYYYFKNLFFITINFIFLFSLPEKFFLIKKLNFDPLILILLQKNFNFKFSFKTKLIIYSHNFSHFYNPINLLKKEPIKN